VQIYISVGEEADIHTGQDQALIRHVFSSQNPHNVCVAAVWIADAEGISEDQIRHHGITSFYSSLFACSRETITFGETPYSRQPTP
jgi:hypothetical protein